MLRPSNQCTRALLALVLVLVSMVITVSCGGGGGGTKLVPIPPAPEWTSPIGRWEVAGEPARYLVDKVYQVVLATSIADPVNRGNEDVLIALYGEGENPALYPASADLRFVPTGDTLINELGEFEKKVAGRGTVAFQVRDAAGHILTTVSFARTFGDGGATPVPPEPVTGLPGTIAKVEIIDGPDPVHPGDSLTLRVYVEGYRIATGETQPPIPVVDANLSNWTWHGSYWTVIWTAPDYPGTYAVGPLIIIVIEPEPENLPPVAKLKLLGDNTGPAPFTVEVDASDSYDPDGYLVSYEYFFYGGGGHFEGGHNITSYTHTYDTPGTYSIHLRVTDDDGATDWSNQAIEVTVTDGQPPGQELQILDTPIELELGEAHQVRVLLKDGGIVIRELDPSELTFVLEGLPTEDSWVQDILSGTGVLQTWQDSGPPDYQVTGYVTPGTYQLTVTYGEVVATVDVTIDFTT